VFNIKKKEFDIKKCSVKNKEVLFNIEKSTDS